MTEKQLPVVVNMGEAAGTVTGTDTVLAAGTVDALCDQIVSGATEAGDVLVIFGATLIVWAVVDDWVRGPGAVDPSPHRGGQGARRRAEQRRRPLRGLGPRPARTAPVVARSGPRQAGPGQRRRWPTRTDTDAGGDPGRVPVWTPYLRGERAPYPRHDARGPDCTTST